MLHPVSISIDPNRREIILRLDLLPWPAGSADFGALTGRDWDRIDREVGRVVDLIVRLAFAAAPKRGHGRRVAPPTVVALFRRLPRKRRGARAGRRR